MTCPSRRQRRHSPRRRLPRQAHPCVCLRLQRQATHQEQCVLLCSNNQVPFHCLGQDRPLGYPWCTTDRTQTQVRVHCVFATFFFAAAHLTCQSLWKSVIQPTFLGHNQQIYINEKMIHSFCTPNNYIFMPSPKIYMFFSIYINFFHSLMFYPLIPQLKCVHCSDPTRVKTKLTMMKTTTTWTHTRVRTANDRRKLSLLGEGTPHQTEVFPPCHASPRGTETHLKTLLLPPDLSTWKVTSTKFI